MIKEEREDITYVIGLLGELCHATAVEKGFYDADGATFDHIDGVDEDGALYANHDANMVLKRLMLIVTEIAEGAEAYRKGNPPSDHIPEYDGLTEELADAIIRIADLAAYLQLPLGAAVVAKMDYNAGRERLHGKVC
jgi:NTP pyrophosphatase (non-canonical NTP hydrolase)